MSATKTSDFELQLPDEMTIADATTLAVKFMQDGNFEPAELLLKRVIETEPNHADALHFLGMLLFELGRGSEGIPMVEKSLELVPGMADWHNNLGIICVRRDKLDDAEAAFEKALMLSDGKLVTAMFNMGILARLKGQMDRAEAYYKRAIEIAPQFPDARYAYASLLAGLGRAEESETQLDHARSMGRMESARMLEALGLGYRRVQQFDKAREIYRRWTKLEPDNAVPAYYLTALSDGGDVPDRAPDDYVAKTFDSFAGSFDSVLAKLGYRAPQLIIDALLAVRPAPDASLQILDAGAGTGLCGPLLRPWAAHLVGVDLSPKMLLQAKDRDCYDALETAELTDFMAQSTARYDVIVSADTLCYFGALEGAVMAAHQALRAGGHLVFSVERDDAAAAKTGFVLQNHGRYAHTKAYVENALTGQGFDVVSIQDAVLRNEGPLEVNGMIVTAQKAQPK